jgi:heavy metal sensor kinase
MSWRALSIRARLTGWYTAVLLVTLIVVSAVSWVVLRWHLMQDLDATLLTMARVLQEAAPPIPRTPLDPEFEDAVRGLLGPEFADGLLQLLDPEGQARMRSRRWSQPRLPLTSAARANAARGDATFETVRDSRGAGVRLLTMPVVRGGRLEDLVQVAMPLRRTEQTLGRYRDTLLVLVPLGVLLAAAGGAVLARRALSPVDEMTRTAQRISAEDLSRRLARRGTDDELDRLADTLNQVLGRLQAAFSETQRFAADAAHELRTPLTALRGGIEVALRADRDAQEYRRVLAGSLEDVDQLIRLAEDLLLLSRTRAGSVPSLDLVDPERLALEALEAGVHFAKGRGVTVRLGRTASAQVRGEAGALRRAIVNLVENAVKYTPAGGTVELLVTAGAEGVEIAVEDTGIGIAPDDRQRIFEPFVRLDDARSRDSGGSGLGLTIARSIVAAHGGRVDVESRPGQGSRFTIHLPAA